MHHVLIIGGGLAGPALALALARQNIRSTIFELRPTRGDSGGSISLAPNALRALDKACGVYDRIRSTGFVHRRISVFDDLGYHFGEIAMTDHESDDYEIVRIMRSEVHKILLAAVEEYPGLISIAWGAKVQRIQESEESVTAFFEDGSQASGDILIGADGIHSKVREHVLGSAAPKPAYIGSCTVSSFTDLELVKVPPHMSFPMAFFTPKGLIMAVPTDPEGRRLAWGVSHEIEGKDRDGWMDYRESGSAIRTAKEYYAHVKIEPIRSLIDNVNEESVNVWTPYSIPDLATWHLGRVCLIGDAAHALPPNGQGSAQAFEDAALLSRLLSSPHTSGLTPDALFARFERLRRPRIQEVARISQKGGQVKGTSVSNWRWTLKKWLIWAYFAWNGFVVKQTGISAYDVMAEDISS